MLRFILDVLLLRQLIESRSVRRAALFIFAVLFVVVLVYTVNLFLTLPERTSGHHVQPNSTH
jgi:hypothetical protein